VGAGTVVGWCIKYWSQYEKAPCKDIQSIYESESQAGSLTEPEEEYIGGLLLSLSSEWEQIAEDEDKTNWDYLLDQTVRWLNRKSLHQLSRDISARLNMDDVEGAETALSDYKSIQKGGTGWVDPFSTESVRTVLEMTEERPLFKLKGALGELFEDQLVRDSLIGIQAPEKRGKTYFMIELAMQAYRSRCRVALFEVGDMSERQMLRRLHSYICKVPLYKKHMDVYVPGFIKLGRDSEKKYRVEGERVEYEPFDQAEIEKKVRQWERRGGGDRFKLSTSPNSSINVAGICRLLDEWEEKHEWIPDVVVIDYADILAPEDGRKEFRHQQNETWKALRALSQNRHCCVITATQASASSYTKLRQGMGDFSEDKRKYAHVTAMYALDQTVKEKGEGLLRVGELVIREGWGMGDQVSVLQCLSVGRPYLDSAWSGEVEDI